MQSVHPSLTVVQIRDKCMTVSPPKSYCSTNKRQMYDSQSTRLTVVRIRDKRMAVSPPKSYCSTNKRQTYDSESTQTLLQYK